MSCRSTPANSAFTTCARLSVSKLVPESAVLSLFHEIKSNATWGYYSREDYLRVIDKEITFATSLRASVISAENKTALLAKLNQARRSPNPDKNTINALRDLRSEIKKLENGIKSFCKDMSVKMDIPVKDMTDHFMELTSVTPRSRGNADTGLSWQQERMARTYNLGKDKRIMFAMVRINAEYEVTLKKRIRETPPRISLVEITDTNAQKTGIKNLLVTHAGYDNRNGRLEITTFNQITRKSKTYAYKDCRNYKNILTSHDAGKIWAEEIRGHSWYNYETPLMSAIAGMAPKCTNCGQFANSSHGCPMVHEPYVIVNGIGNTWTNEVIGTAKTLLPQANLLNNALMAGAVTIEGVRYNARGDYSGSSFGSVTIYRDEENKIRINSSQLACRCNDYDDLGQCKHTNAVIKGINQRINPVRTSIKDSTPAQIKKLVQKAQARIIAEEELALKKILESDWTLIPKELKEAKKNWRDEAPVLYSKDFNAFNDDFKKAIAKTKTSKEAAIPYMKSNVLDGMATRESGQGFGVEIEYEFESELSYIQQDRANKAIGRALFEAKLIPDSEQQDYHSAKDIGYTDVHIDSEGKGTWSFENDGSVDGGEIVSPIMYDEKDTWDKLEQVIKILRDHHAIPTKNAGSHVHVGTGFYGSSPVKYAELVQLMNQHEDVLYRLATDPSRGTHRGLEYSEPVKPINPVGFKQIGSVRNQTDRYSALNLGSVKGVKKDHVEFRLFDSTLDPGTIQTQIKIAVAMTNAAVRTNRRVVVSRPKEELGAHVHKKEILSKINKKETLEEETTTLRSLLDTLFLRRKDKAQAVAVFANTKWTKKDKTNYNDDDD